MPPETWTSAIKSKSPMPANSIATVQNTRKILKKITIPPKHPVDTGIWNQIYIPEFIFDDRYR